MTAKTFIVRQVKSQIGRSKSHQACLVGLGIRRLHKPVTVPATPENVGMINKIAYMLIVEVA